MNPLLNVRNKGKNGQIRGVWCIEFLKLKKGIKIGINISLRYDNYQVGID
jgi:hypothetical protein